MKYVAFDFFDTIVHRKCHPESILMEWSRRISLYFKCEFSARDIYLLRKHSEKMIKQNKEEGTYSELLRYMYDEISSQKDISQISYESFFKYAYEEEIGIEKRNLYLDEKIMDEIISYRKECSLVIISDFYLPKNFFEYILDEFNIREYFQEIFVSSEIGKRKSSGTLYQYIIRTLNINPNDLLMIGDNVNSDVKVPVKLGISSKHKPYMDSSLFLNKRDLYHQLNTKLKQEREDELFNGYVPVLLIFIDKLYKKCTQDGCHKLLFCSREGQNLKRLFDLYQEYFLKMNTIKTEYFEVSRRATLLPSLKDINQEKFERIFRQYEELPIKDFLYSIGFDYDEIANIVLKHNLEDTNLITSVSDDAWVTLSKDVDFIKLYETKRLEQKELFKHYVEKVNGNLSDVYLVDIGWKGTIQDNIFEALDQKVKIYGYYFGLFTCQTSSMNIKSGIMFNENKRDPLFNLYSYNYVELERVFAADHGQVLSYIKNGKKVIPVKSQNSKDTELYNYISNWQFSMNSVYLAVLKLIAMSSLDINDLYKYLTLKYLKHLCISSPRWNNVYLDFRKKNKENFGNVSGSKLKKESSYFRDKRMKREFLYVDYSYKIFDKLKINILTPLAKLYCYFVYAYQKFKFSKRI